MCSRTGDMPGRQNTPPHLQKPLPGQGLNISPQYLVEYGIFLAQASFFGLFLLRSLNRVTTKYERAQYHAECTSRIVRVVCVIILMQARVRLPFLWSSLHQVVQPVDT